MPDDLEVSGTGTFGLYLVNTLTEQLQGVIELNRHDGVELEFDSGIANLSRGESHNGAVSHTNCGE